MPHDIPLPGFEVVAPCIESNSPNPPVENVVVPVMSDSKPVVDFAQYFSHLTLGQPAEQLKGPPWGASSPTLTSS